MKAAESPFQPISLSPNDTTQLQVITKAILDASLDRYHLFTSVDSGTVDAITWKLVKTKGNLSAFVQRQRRQASLPFQVNPTINTSALQSLLCVGLIPGTLEDVMTRVINPREDDLGQASLLSRVKAPTPTDRFKSMAVKWMELDVRFKSMGLVKCHDYVYVEASGILQPPNGVRIGYHLLHSVDVPRAHTLQGRTRGKLSVCSFFRQLNKTTVSVYTLGMMDAMSDRARRVIIPRFINALMSTSRNCSERKRLIKPKVGQDCVVCSKRVVRLGKFWNGNKICSVCSGCVCNACKSEKKVKFVTAYLKVTQKKLVFCSLCLSGTQWRRMFLNCSPLRNRAV